jgi:hypothetical protein
MLGRKNESIREEIVINGCSFTKRPTKEILIFTCSIENLFTVIIISQIN